MIGATIGAYTITGVIGEGGMGVVYAAKHALLDRPAAIKILRPEMSSEPELVGRFFNEARAITQIRHPGIVELYDYGHIPNGTAYIAMEYLVGENLRRRLMSERRLSSGETLALMRQIANALGAAHAVGIIHRDLKPDNVFLVRDPDVPTGKRIKLLDFGIAKLAGYDPRSGTNPKTRTGAVLGTPTYMSPEQVRGAALDERADIYSLGCLMFEMMTGRPPFESEILFDLLQAHVAQPAPRVSSLVTGVPVMVDELVQRMLIKDPDARIQKCEHLVAMLDEIEPSLATGAYSRPALLTTLTGAMRTLHTPPPVAPPRRTLFIAMGMALAAALAVTLVIGLRGRGGGDATAQPAAQPAAPAPAPAPAPPPPEPTAAVPGVFAPTPPPVAPPDAGAGSAVAAPVPRPTPTPTTKRPPPKRPGVPKRPPAAGSGDDDNDGRDAAYNPFSTPGTP
jgi:eukaryotic-like serine/threonine-protein kinase